MKNCFITESKVPLNKEVDVKQPAKLSMRKQLSTKQTELFV